MNDSIATWENWHVITIILTAQCQSITELYAVTFVLLSIPTDFKLMVFITLVSECSSSSFFTVTIYSCLSVKNVAITQIHANSTCKLESLKKKLGWSHQFFKYAISVWAPHIPYQMCY